jgi:hypothetical protein
MKSLDDSLRELSHALASAAPPDRVDRGVAQAIGRAARRRAPADGGRMFDRWLLWPVALAASILAISAIVRQVPPSALAPTPDPDAAESRAFLPLASDEEIGRSADAVVVATRLPRVALAQMGLPVDPARADQSVEAELLVRPDGAVLAFRFVN